MAFERFYSKSKSLTPTVSGFLKSGRLAFSRPAFEKYRLQDKKGCWLHFDADRKLIGFEFLDEPENGCLSVKYQERNHTFTVAAFSFSRHFGICLEKIHYVPIIEMDGMLVIDVSGAVVSEETDERKDTEC